MATIYRYDKTPETERDFQDWSCSVCLGTNPENTCIHGDEKRHIFHIDCMMQSLAQRSICPLCLSFITQPRTIQEIPAYGADQPGQKQKG